LISPREYLEAKNKLSRVDLSGGRKKGKEGKEGEREINIDEPNPPLFPFPSVAVIIVYEYMSVYESARVCVWMRVDMGSERKREKDRLML